MDSTEFLPLLPDLMTIAEQFAGSTVQCRQPERIYRGFRLYSGQHPLAEDTVYLIRPGDAFPRDQFPWISGEMLTGEADHICCPGFSREEILDGVLELFSRLREQEHLLDGLLYRNSGLEELCELGANLLNNPMYIHDDWFIMMAKSAQVNEILAPEYVMSSEKGFLPRVIIDDFRDDSDYLETYAFRTAQRWESGGGVPPCLYVNLWDGAVYRGRLLIVETNHSIRHEDFRLAEVLAQAALQMMHRKQLGEHAGRSMDDIMFELLQGRQPEASDQTLLLNMLQWSKEDRLLCVRIQSQQPNMSAVTEHALHSDLFRSFPNGYIMLTDSQQCLILNLTRNPRQLGEIRHALAPLCRDYLLYAGLSSPVEGMRDLHLAYYQAEIALNQAFRIRNEKWILPFSECVLEHILGSMNSPLQPWHLVSPDLHRLIEFDREKGTPYFETLREYLLQERDIPRTSEKLIIHRTTLLYRLRKIRSMISSNLDDPWQRLNLMLSLRILENEGGESLRRIG